MSYANAIRIQVVNNKFPTSGRTSACCSVSVPFSDFIFPILYFIFPISYFLFHISYYILYCILYCPFIVRVLPRHCTTKHPETLLRWTTPHIWKGREGKRREGLEKQIQMQKQQQNCRDGKCSDVPSLFFFWMTLFWDSYITHLITVSILHVSLVPCPPSSCPLQLKPDPSPPSVRHP